MESRLSPCQMCGSAEGSLLFMDLYVLCPSCWVSANGRAMVQAEEQLSDLACGGDDELEHLEAALEAPA